MNPHLDLNFWGEMFVFLNNKLKHFSFTVSRSFGESFIVIICKLSIKCFIGWFNIWFNEQKYKDSHGQRNDYCY